MWLIANAKNGISSNEVHRALGVTQKSAWFMLHRIRLAMQTGTYVSVREWDLFRYLDEEAFRFNQRKLGEGGRFEQVIGAVTGKRLESIKNWWRAEPPP